MLIRAEQERALQPAQILCQIYSHVLSLYMKSIIGLVTLTAGLLMFVCEICTHVQKAPWGSLGGLRVTQANRNLFSLFCFLLLQVK